MNRREFLKSSAVFASMMCLPSALRKACGAAATSSSAPVRKPNVLLILADDQGYAELGVQGCKDVPTPNIDSLAKNGIRFSDGYVACCLCSPSRAGLMTGKYPESFGYEFNPGPPSVAPANFGLPLTETTFADRFKKMGYATGVIGKWHLGYKPELHPLKRGFDEFYGFLSGAHNYLPGKGKGKEPILRGEERVEQPEYTTDAFARETVEFIDRHKSEPFFLYLSFNAVHSPLEATDKYLKRFESMKDGKRKKYAAMTAALDDAVGLAMDKLRELKLEEDTIVIYLSDNGGPTGVTTSLNTPLKGAKGNVYEGGIRIPFIMHWKNHLPAGEVYKKPVISLDLMPTCIAAAGEKVDPEWKLDGINLLPYLRDETTDAPHETLFWRMGDKRAIRQGDWKLVAPGKQEFELYNLAEDISETKDLAKEQSEKAKQLREIFESWSGQMKQPLWGSKPSKGKGNNAEQEE